MLFRSADKAMIKRLTGTDETAGRRCLSGLQVLIKQLTGDFQAADWCLSRGCIGAFLSAEWAVVKRLTDTDQVVDQALNDQQSRK